MTIVNEVLDRVTDRKLSLETNNYTSITHDPRYPYSPENPYFQEGLVPDDPDYPQNAQTELDENNYYSELNPYGPKYTVRDVVSEERSRETLSRWAAEPSPQRYWDRVRGPRPPPNPFEDPGAPDDSVPSEALRELCQHLLRVNENGTLREQLEGLIRQMCVDPTGQPDPDGGAESECAGFTVELTGDVLDLVGDSRCADSADCEPGSVEDRLNRERRWQSFVGVQLVERCNPLICRSSDAAGVFDVGVAARDQYGAVPGEHPSGRDPRS